MRMDAKSANGCAETGGPIEWLQHRGDEGCGALHSLQTCAEVAPLSGPRAAVAHLLFTSAC
jgi:hypothetical protein